MSQRIIPAFFIVCIMVIGFIAETGCASIIPPSGGPRDSLPPRLISATPKDSALNFSGNKLTLNFDEFIEVQNIQQQLIISPIQEINPVVDYKLRTLTVRLKDSLEENTTYTFNFGNAIKDVNEGNSLNGFSYTFSTGNYIDSLSLSGKLIIAETGKIDTTLIAILHKSGNDSAIINNKPRYISKLNSKGEFNFKNLPAGTFYLYAIKDESGIGKLLGRDQLFAFADIAIETDKQPKSQILYAYMENISPIAAKKPDLTKPEIGYQTNLQAKQLDLLSDLELNFELPLKSFDSTKIRLASDSGFLPVTNIKWIKDSSASKYTLRTNWIENKLYHLILDKNFAEDTLGRKSAATDTISFNTKKLSEYGSISLRLKDLDLSKNPVLLFILNNIVVHSFPLSSDRFQQKLFKPGEYELRIVNDRNKNGRWDAGNFFGSRLQPETVIPIERRVSIKANWDNEIEILIPKTQGN